MHETGQSVCLGRRRRECSWVLENSVVEGPDKRHRRRIHSRVCETREPRSHRVPRSCRGSGNARSSEHFKSPSVSESSLWRWSCPSPLSATRADRFPPTTIWGSWWWVTIARHREISNLKAISYNSGSFISDRGRSGQHAAIVERRESVQEVQLGILSKARRQFAVQASACAAICRLLHGQVCKKKKRKERRKLLRLLTTDKESRYPQDDSCAGCTTYRTVRCTKPAPRPGSTISAC